MRRISVVLMVLVVLVFAPNVFATNGTNLIGIGTISRSMGGVGIASPQDAISATFANPAGMCFGPYCPGAQVDFDATFFMPKVEAKVSGTIPAGLGGGTFLSQEKSDDKVYAIPAIGISAPINERLRFGLSAYGVSGLGVDYRNSGLNIAGNDGEIATQLQIMKFSPNIAYLVRDNLSVGLGLQIDYSALDLGEGGSFGYGFGAKLGVLWKITDMISTGLTYTTEQAVDHKNVSDFNQDGTFNDLELAAPQEVGVGVAVEPMKKLLLALDGKWVNWSSAKGYEDFDWEDQFVIAVGAQYLPMEKLALRIGYNYGKNPVKEHSNWDAANPKSVQGTPVFGGEFGYEYLRVIGFPAIAQHHITAGFGYDVTSKFVVTGGFMYSPEEKITTDGFIRNPAAPTVPIPTTLESTLSETSVELGLTWRF